MKIKNILLCVFAISFLQQVNASRRTNKKGISSGIKKYYKRGKDKPISDLQISIIRKQWQEANKELIKRLRGDEKKTDDPNELKENRHLNRVSQGLSFKLPKMDPEEKSQELKERLLALKSYTGMGFSLKITSKSGKVKITPRISYDVLLEFVILKDQIRNERSLQKRREYLTIIQKNLSRKYMRPLNYLESRFGSLMIALEQLLLENKDLSSPEGALNYVYTPNHIYIKAMTGRAEFRNTTQQTRVLLHYMNQHPIAKEFFKLYCHYNFFYTLKAAEITQVKKEGIDLIPAIFPVFKQTGKISMLDIYFIVEVLGGRVVQYENYVLYDFIQQAFLHHSSPFYLFATGQYFSKKEMDSLFEGMKNATTPEEEAMYWH